MIMLLFSVIDMQGSENSSVFLFHAH